MSLNQAIKHGKEHRKQFTGPKAVDKWCENHNRCWICRRNRLHKRMVELIEAKDKMKESE